MVKIRNSRVYKLSIILFSALSMIIVWLLQPINVQATETVDKLDGLLIIEEYSVTDGKIVPGDEFTLTLKVTNSANYTLSSALISVNNPSGVIPKYGTVTQLMLSDFKAGETREISFDYTASSYLDAECISFTIALVSSINMNTVVLTIPVGNEQPLQILAVSIPDHAVSGEVLVANINFQTVGNSNVDDVVVSVESNDTVIGSSSIGTITAGANKTQGVSFSLNDTGVQYVDLCISYRNESGMIEKFVIQSSQISVDKYTSGEKEAVPTVITEDNTNQMIVGVCLILLLLVFGAIAVILRRNRR